MVRLDRITMQGFKSFANRITIPFPSGFNTICGPNGSGKCLSGDALVRMEDGSLIQIKNLENINKKILALNKEGKIVSAEKAKFYKRNVKKMLKIKLHSGKEIKLTPEHP